jgi:hypothetical protein
MIIIFAGSIGRFPIGGHAWVSMQYLLGLAALGHQVYYLEECGEGSWVYNWQTDEVTTELDYPTSYVRDCLQPVGFGDRWLYRVGDQSVGCDFATFLDVCRQADLLIVRGAPLPLWRAEYQWPQRRVFLDVDPGFTQIRLANGNNELTQTAAQCERLFTIAQRLGAADCPIPTVGREWIKTVSPVHLPSWPCLQNINATHFTTIMQWHSYKDVVYNGVSYGNKEKEFPTFMDLPQFTPQSLQIALTGASHAAFTQHGWEVVEGWQTSLTPSAYQNFIQQSRAEFCVAKQGYVATRGGWFSDRSVCYLASGRPVLVQDTGLHDWLPCDKGALTFHDMSSALRGIEEINSKYEEHCRAARQLAEQHFDAEQVLSTFLTAAMA